MCHDGAGKQTEIFEFGHKYVLHYIPYASPSPFFEFINAIIAKRYLAQYLSVQSPHSTAAILFCDIIDNTRNVVTTSRNVIADIAHYGFRFFFYFCSGFFRLKGFNLT